MKYILIPSIALLFLVTIIMINSCGKTTVDRIITEKFTYINKSGHDISFIKYHEKKIIKLQLNKGQTMTQTVLVSTLGNITGGDSCIAWLDSVRIVFDNNKSVFFKDNRVPATKFNIQNTENYKLVSRSNNFIHREYSFTEEDYNNAVDCNGSCE